MSSFSPEMDQPGAEELERSMRRLFEENPALSYSFLELLEQLQVNYLNPFIRDVITKVTHPIDGFATYVQGRRLQLRTENEQKRL